MKYTVPLYISSFFQSKKTQGGVRNIQGEFNTIITHQNNLENVTFNIQGSHNLILIHPNVHLSDVDFNIYGDRHRIIIGENCRFNGKGSIWAEDENCLISIGRDTTFEGIHLSATETGSRLLIGEDCMFSYDIDIRTGDSHSIISTENGLRYNYAKDVVFGNHVWVASHCIFTKGVLIPSNCVVGTGSLINKAFKEENTVIAGRPAEVVRQKVNWLRERIYQQAGVKELPETEDLNQSSKTVNFSERLKKIG
ncbi:MAG: hypothetical protein OQK04_05865 [Kangiellaceae bacterium]|nr:hypothetical protein [Kangiellaceae bacterium]MCW8998222.1 hypothetical protein [Kangiellaceae bacterium]